MWLGCNLQSNVDVVVAIDSKVTFDGEMYVTIPWSRLSPSCFPAFVLVFFYLLQDLWGWLSV